MINTIIAVNGNDIKNSDELYAELNNYDYGDDITLTVYRGNKTLNLKLKIGVWNY
ncbi:PDZ domain-containing protein [Marinitoga sp. 1197]|uniref:PDZ domain-containing protein n=1 Tax=Marinitoga sp. 1197 TaxID=1428449 RepID=UPI0018CF17DE|nr:PDZ domain-containing protein [Marinitoga sp. 1197]